MISILDVFRVGEVYYQLAERHGMNKWLFGTIGIVVFFMGLTIGGMGISFCGEMTGLFNVASISLHGLAFLSIPIGLLVSWGCYKILKKSWSDN